MRNFPLVAILLLGFALRIHEINRFALRGDEAFTVIHWMREPLSETIANISTIDPQPPLAYAVYRAWGLIVGSQEYIVRYLPALVNVLGISALYVLGKRFTNHRGGVLAALLWAIHPFQIWHAQDARNYALWGAASPTALAAALIFLDRPRWRGAVRYLLAAVVACYLYYLELFFVAALNVYVLIAYWRDRPRLLRWMALQAVLAAALSVWFLQGRLLFRSGYTGTATAFDLSGLITSFVPVLAFGDTSLLSWAASLGVFIFALFAASRGWMRRDWLIVLWIVLPFTFLSVVSIRLNVFTPRYVLSVSVALALIWVLAWSRLSQSFFRVIFVVVVVVFSSASVAHYFGWFTDYAKSPKWRDLADYLRLRTAEDDLIIQSAADEAFTLYFDDYGVPGRAVRLPANPNQAESEITSIVQRGIADYNSVWIAAHPPLGWTNGDTALLWLNDYAQRIRQTTVEGLPVWQFMRWDITAQAGTPLAAFDGRVALQTVHVAEHPEPTGVWTVWLEWLPLAYSPQPLKSFLHVVGAINPATGTPLWSQDDQFPQDGRINALEWNAPFRDVYSLPIHSLPQGEYTLLVGWYDPETNRRLPLETASADSYPIGTISLP